MTQRFREILFIPLSALAALALWAGAAHGSEPVRLETFKTHSRLSIRLDDGVVSEWKPTREGFELLLKGVGLADLGAPLGEEAEWIRRFAELRDSRITGLSFADTQAGLRIQGRWKFPTGNEAPAQPVMEAFDYRDPAASALVVDFWMKDGPSVAELRGRRDAARKLASVRARQDAERARAARRAAKLKARAEAEDPALFCRTPLDEEGDVFLQFQPFHENVDLSRWIPRLSPDANYAWPEAPKGAEAKDGGDKALQYVSLARKLYAQKNYALVDRAIRFFEEEHPRSGHAPVMKWLRANSYFKLGMKEETLRLLKELMHEPKSPEIALQSALFVLGTQLDGGNHLAALETFMWLQAREAKSPLRWVYHLGAAESARALRQTDRAAKEYEWVAENAPDPRSRAEGALRAGDLFMERFQYDQGLAAYAQGLRHFAREAEAFPSVHINRAEALYGLGQLERASEAFKGFLAKYPAHPSGWRAAYRLGEIESRKAGATREAAEARRWYLETVNRFPFSPGATLARLQLMPCGDHAGFTAEAIAHFFANEAESFDGAGEVMMDRYKDFRALARVRTLMTLGKEDDAVLTAITELRRVPRIEARRWLGSLLAMSFRKTVLAHLAAGRKLEALTFYEKNEGSVPRTEARVDPDYLLKLSQAASDLGLGKLAETLNQDYERTRRISAGPQRALASGAGENPDEDPEVKLQLSERRFTEAKALWIGTGLAAEDRIRAALGSVAPESRFSYERELILGLMDDKRGRTESALKHAVRAQLLSPGSRRDARIEAWVASLEARGGDARAALAGYRSLEATAPAPGAASQARPGAAELLGVPAVPAREALVLAQSEILEKLGRWGDAAANYARAVEKGLGGGQAAYGYARALLRSGERAKGLAALEKLADGEPAGAKKATPEAAAAKAVKDPKDAKAEKDRFWRKLASETLANEKTRENAKEGMRQ